ncbi:vitamin K epoxide reductase family protein [Dactylosporangium sp. NPDC051484]|uniref:vitamin K epoxide reductase family protein n=1 Tax=Dactylosporangium sp. NPDC051484 TaxID=3154942 RepID=UPI00344B09BC
MAGLLGRLHRIRHANAWLFTTMLVSSCLSLLASFVLSVEAVTLAADPNANLSCNINSVISCGTVGSAWQSHLFGFPNAFLGLIAEPVVITLAVASLAGVRFPRGFMFAAQVVYTVGLVFAYWLLYQSMFHIGALCPWCLLVTVSTTLVFSTLTHVNIRDRNLFLPPRVQAALSTMIRANLDLMVVVIWMLVLVLAIVVKYGDRLFG